MLNRNDIKQIAEAEFIARNPRLAAELFAITSDDVCEISAEEERETRLYKEFNKVAAIHGFSDASDYQLVLAESLGHNVSHIRAEERRKVAEILGIDDRQ